MEDGSLKKDKKGRYSIACIQMGSAVHTFNPVPILVRQLPEQPLRLVVIPEIILRGGGLQEHRVRLGEELGQGGQPA
jgi:hypothetical protein